MNESDDVLAEISRRAFEYDPAREADALQARALLQGILAGTVMKGELLRISDVEQGIVDGEYEHYFVVVTKSGHRLKVAIEVE